MLAYTNAHTRKETLMSHKNRLYVFMVILTTIGLIFNLGIADVFASPPDPITPEAHSMSTPTKVPSTATPTPDVQIGAEPEAWLDGGIDPGQFGSMNALVIHFNTPMSPESTLTPVLSWPLVEGASSWDAAGTTLTFKPGSALEGNKTYTFFLDTSLRSSDGKKLKIPAEWIVHLQSGPKVKSLSPQPGILEKHQRVIEIQFDRKMKPASPAGMVQIEPHVEFDLKWKNNQTLQVILKQPFDNDQRYDLTLRGGNNNLSIFAADGSYLTEDYRWYYWQQPFDMETNLLGERTLSIKFNYMLNQDKSGKPFNISPQLKGKWMWNSSDEIRFISEEPIPASKEFNLNLVHPLVDSSGFEISSIPAITFSGLPPVRLVNTDIVKTEYNDTLIANVDVLEIRIEFSQLVDHASAEKAFLLSPTIPGRFYWEKSSNGSKEILVYNSMS